MRGYLTLREEMGLRCEDFIDFIELTERSLLPGDWSNPLYLFDDSICLELD